MLFSPRPAMRGDHSIWRLSFTEASLFFTSKQIKVEGQWPSSAHQTRNSGSVTSSVSLRLGVCGCKWHDDAASFSSSC
jgi:hypothetical protein